jgi:YD repeat-containing protein
MINKNSPFILYLFVFVFINSVAAETINYEYDGLHRLTQVTLSNGTIVVYNYDGIGNRNSKVVTLPIVAGFTGSPVSGPAPIVVSFVNQSTGNITSWLWDFGDGQTSSLQNPSHEYLAPGTYTVRLTVTGPSGATGVEEKVGYITLSGLVDTDNDGMPDSWEIEHNLNPLVNDAFGDADGDGFCNLREYLSGSNPQNVNDKPSILADFEGDNDVDGKDVSHLIYEYGRNDCETASDPCEFDLDTDGDVDEIDLRLFIEDYGRTQN